MVFILDNTPPFHDRREAGAELAKRLEHYKGRDDLSETSDTEVRDLLRTQRPDVSRGQ